jgi:hypothetical protein
MLQPDANAVVRSGVIPQLRDADMEKEWYSTLKKFKVTAEKTFLFSDFKAGSTGFVLIFVLRLSDFQSDS